MARQRHGGVVLPGHPSLKDQQLNGQQLGEGEPAPGVGELDGGVREMHLTQRPIDGQQVMLVADGWRERVGHARGEMGERPVNAAAQLALGEAGGQWMNGDQAPGVDCGQVAAFVGRVVQDQLPTLLDELAAERNSLARLNA